MNIDWHGVRTETGEWKYPYINAGTGTWWTWDEDTGTYIDSEIPARGPQGDPGIQGVKGDPGRDGRDGTGVYVIGIDQSSVDGGANYINFSDGTTLIVRNGNTGATGPAGRDGINGLPGADGETGPQGPKGDPGIPGAGVTVVDVSESDVDGGTNIVTFSDGTTLAVKNGNTGSQGPRGYKGERGNPGQNYEITQDDYALIAGVVLSKVDDVVTQAIEDINDEKAGAISDIEDKGEEVMESIPEDYSELSADVSSLKEDIQSIEHDVSGLKSALGFFAIDGTNPEILDTIHRVVQAGEAPEEFGIGEQINLAYKNGTTDYILPWDIVAFGNFELEGGTVKPGMVIQSHYAMQAVQFSASQAIMKCASALAPGTYHFTIGTTWGTHCVQGKVYQFTTTVEVPADGQIVIGTNSSFYTWGAPDVNPTNWRVYTFSDASSTTPLETLTLTEGSGGTDLGTLSSSTKFGASGLTNLQMAAYGYNRWSKSANRQFYNSAAAAGAWWTPQHDCDRPPQQLASVQGFMKGFDSAFLDIIAPVKVTTALNTVTDGDIGTSENTYDTFFLPSLEQEYIVPQLSGVEGSYFPYWKERLGLESPQGTGAANANARHIRYGFDAKSTAQYCRLRSANRGTAYSTWYVSTTGYAGSTNATSANRGCPACVII